MHQPAAHSFVALSYAAMHDRTTLGFAADAAETAALTMADAHSTERIFAACDAAARKHERKKAIDALSIMVERRFGKKYARMARAMLRGEKPDPRQVPERTFCYARKKLQDFFQAHKQRVKPLLRRVAAG